MNTHTHIKTLIYDREADCVQFSYFKLKNEEMIHYTSIYKIKHNREKLYSRKKLISISTYIGKNKNIYLYQDWFKLALLAWMVSTIVAESKTYRNTIQL